MKKLLLFLFLGISLVLPGSGLVTGLNAQTTLRKSLRAGSKSARVQKTSVEAMGPIIKQIALKRQSGKANLGDPCLEDTPIAFGQTINGALTSTDCVLEDDTLVDFYVFSGTSGQRISISYSSDAYDTVLYLLDGDFNVVASNDDIDFEAGNTNSRIPPDGVVTLPYTGEFFIATNQYVLDAGVTGNYTLTLSNTPASCAAATITYNQTVNNSLTESDCHVDYGAVFYSDYYEFHGTAGQQISIAQNSTAVNSYLILYTPSGDDIQFDDDSGGGSNSRIPETGLYTLLETGTYIIEASSADPEEVGAYSLTLTGPNVVPTVRNKPFDYDGDGKADLSLFRPSSATWIINNSGTANSTSFVQFGLNGDTIVPADFDGDGKTDFGVYRPAQNLWVVLNSSNLTASFVTFGLTGDIPLAGDYDGDNKADYVVFRPSTGAWWILQSSNGVGATVTFGVSGDIPQSGDFDGDGKNDIAVYRPSEGVWYRINSSNLTFTVTPWGYSTDIAAPADFDGDGKTDINVYRPSEGNWYTINSGNGSTSVRVYGQSGDKPIPADYDGDGKADLAVFRSSNNAWYLNRSTSGETAQVFGLTGDVIVPGAYVR